MEDDGISQEELLAQLADAARNFGGPVNSEARAHMTEGLLSQLYGMGKDGQLKFLGGELDEPPGFVDEMLSLPLLFGSDNQVSVDAGDRLERLKQKLYQDMKLEEPHGLTQHAASALGTMLGSVPTGEIGLAKKLAELIKLRKIPKALKIPAKIAGSAVEWAMPTINPKLENYLMGTAFGGGLGILGEGFREPEPQTLSDLIREEYTSDYSPDTSDNPGMAKGGRVGKLADLASMLYELPQRFLDSGWKPLSEIDRANVKKSLRSPSEMTTRVMIPHDKLGNPAYLTSSEFRDLVRDSLAEDFSDQHIHPAWAEAFSISGQPEKEDLGPVIESWRKAIQPDPENVARLPQSEGFSNESGVSHRIRLRGPKKIVDRLDE